MDNQKNTPPINFRRMTLLVGIFMILLIVFARDSSFVKLVLQNFATGESVSCPSFPAAIVTLNKNTATAQAISIGTPGFSFITLDIKANSCGIRLNSLSFKSYSDGVGHATVAHLTLHHKGEQVGATLSGSSNSDFTGLDILIPAGTTQSFELRGDVVGDVGQSVGFAYNGMTATDVRSNLTSLVFDEGVLLSGNIMTIVEPRTISSCQTIDTPGSYVLTRDIISRDTSPCLHVASDSVAIDCEGNSIYAKDVPSIVVDAVSYVTIRSCAIGRNDPVHSATLEIKNNSRDVVVVSNTVYGMIKATKASRVSVENNNITLPLYSDESFAPVWLSGGSLNHVSENTIDGSSPGDRTMKVGSDDGVLLENETNDTISDNTIHNVYDCGIETIGSLTHSVVDRNLISNAGQCGIGGWYGLTITDTIFSNNILDDTFAPFVFFYSDGYGYWSKISADFSNNKFIGNIFTHPKEGIALLPGGHPAEFAILPKGALLRMGITAEHNIFMNNNFGTYMAPLIWPVGIAEDGGGNSCGPIVSTPPLFIYDEANKYPLDCESTAS